MNYCQRMKPVFYVAIVFLFEPPQRIVQGYGRQRRFTPLHVPSTLLVIELGLGLGRLILSPAGILDGGDGIDFLNRCTHDVGF